MANGNGGQTPHMATVFANIFTEKVVGLAFAIAFAAWAWNVNSLKETITNIGDEIKIQIERQHEEIEDLRATHISDREKTLTTLIAIQERQVAILQRLDRELKNGNGYGNARR